MEEIGGNGSRVIIYENFTELSDKFLKEFRNEFCGKLRLQWHPAITTARL